MKIGIVGDIHLGINEGNQSFVDYQMKCINFIFEEFEKLGIKKVIFLGDVYDKRQAISVKALKLSHELFNNNFEQYFILGNHDTAFKSSNYLNSVEILLGDNNFVYSNLPEEVTFDKKKFLLTPWINKSNTEESNKIIKKSKADYMFAHLDLTGFEMIRGIVSRTGHVSLKLLNNFEHVISGHYHCYSNKGNITYLGNICEMSWIDYEVEKFCGWVDTKTDDLNLIKIPHTMYEKIKIKSDKDCVNADNYKDKIVKIYLHVDRNVKIEKFILSVIDVASSVNVIDEKAIITTTDVEIEDEDITVLDLWKNYVEEVDMEKSERIIVTEIFEEAYLRVTVGDV